MSSLPVLLLSWLSMRIRMMMPCLSFVCRGGRHDKKVLPSRLDSRYSSSSSYYSCSLSFFIYFSSFRMHVSHPHFPPPCLPVVVRHACMTSLVSSSLMQMREHLEKKSLSCLTGQLSYRFLIEIYICECDAPKKGKSETLFAFFNLLTHCFFYLFPSPPFHLFCQT